MIPLKKYLFLLFLLVRFALVQAQQEAAVWYFGYNAGVDFNSGAPTVLTDGELSTDEGCATISDTNGNLLFYTDGITVWNRNHIPMPNGTALRGDPSSTQSAIIVPKSDEPNIFYVFTVDNIGGPDGLQYNIVDMDLDGGLGDVTAQKNILLHTPVSEKVTAVLHADGNAVWVVTKGWQSNAFLSFRVDDTGVTTTPVVSNVGFTPTDATIINQEAHGYLKASPDGRLLAAAYFSVGAAEIYRFNNATGEVTDPISLQGFLDDFWYYEKPYGVEFSPNSSILYVTVQAGVLQFDVSTYDETAVLASGMMISPFNSSPPFLGALQTAIDGKIYCTRAFRRYLNVINEPNVLGMGCDYQEQVVNLGSSARGVLGLPPFLTSYFNVGIEAENFCLGEGTDFSIDTNNPITAILWDFGDGNTSTLETPSHTYTGPGTYTVNVNVTTATASETESKEITIYEVPVANSLTSLERCSLVPNPEIDPSVKDAEVLGTQSPATFTVSYHASMIDAQNNTDPLPTLYTNTLPTETIYVRVQNANNPDCYDTTGFDLLVKAAPELHPVSDWTVCDTDTDGLFTFDLSQKDVEAYQGQDTSVFSVSYFNSQVDADANLNALATSYTNTVAVETLYYRIFNTTYPECYETGSFRLEVINGVIANAPDDIEVCDTDNDGFFTFDLSVVEAEIIGVQNAASLNVSFHGTLADAQNHTNAHNAIAFTNSTPRNERVYVRVENSSDTTCFDTTSFEVRVFDTPELQTVENWYVCDDDNDGYSQFDLTQKNTEILGSQSPTNFTVSYHTSPSDAFTNSNPITVPFTNTINPQTLFYRVQHVANTSCFVTDDLVIEVLDTPTASVLSPIVVCDTEETGVQAIDLSAKDAEVLGSQDASMYEINYFRDLTDAVTGQNALSKDNYVNSLPQETLYVRVQNNRFDACYELTELVLNIEPLPRPKLQETYVICPDSPDLTIDAGDFETWSWRDASGTTIGSERMLEVTDLGTYSLTVSQTQNGLSCEKTVLFEVVSSGAPEDIDVTVEGFSNQLELIVDVVGNGFFEYSVDGEDFQENNRFVLSPDTYTVYVRDIYACRTLSQQVIALGYEKFFTPNSDGANEYWNVIGMESFPGSKLTIYDRYGKLIQQLDPEGPGWDGRYQGLSMPSSDYWFRFEKGDGAVFTGHFSLKR